MEFCSYYQAHVDRTYMWFLVATLRSFEHLVFDRTINTKESIVEFFIPHDLEHYFLEIMQYFERNNIVFNLQKLPNRLSDPAEKI